MSSCYALWLRQNDGRDTVCGTCDAMRPETSVATLTVSTVLYSDAMASLVQSATAVNAAHCRELSFPTPSTREVRASTAMLS